ncbi:MAG: hypothetical protein LC662_11445 [Rhodothermaceae bacterium]|nr:hypothetical protein [Rhodothermaceae bacterium]
MKYSLLIFLIVIFGCSSNLKSEKEFKLKDFIELSEVEKIVIHNTKGEHEVSINQFSELLDKVGELKWLRNESDQVGDNAIVLTIKGKEYYIYGQTNGHKFEVHSSIVVKNTEEIADMYWLYFESDKLDVNNY